jgi:hypothetical protein
VTCSDLLSSLCALGSHPPVPTDCAQRERRGWLGDAHLGVEGVVHTAFAPTAYAKFLTDISDTQEDERAAHNGSIPEVCPNYGHGSIPYVLLLLDSTVLILYSTSLILYSTVLILYSAVLILYSTVLILYSTVLILYSTVLTLYSYDDDREHPVLWDANSAYLPAPLFDDSASYGRGEAQAAAGHDPAGAFHDNDCEGTVHHTPYTVLILSAVHGHSVHTLINPCYTVCALINHCCTVCTLINHCYTVCTLINHCYRTGQGVGSCLHRAPCHATTAVRFNG